LIVIWTGTVGSPWRQSDAHSSNALTVELRNPPTSPAKVDRVREIALEVQPRERKLRQRKDPPGDREPELQHDLGGKLKPQMLKLSSAGAANPMSALTPMQPISCSQ